MALFSNSELLSQAVLVISAAPSAVVVGGQSSHLQFSTTALLIFVIVLFFWAGGTLIWLRRVWQGRTTGSLRRLGCGVWAWRHFKQILAGCT